MTEGKGRPVVVTTEHRGVFFGFCRPGDTTGKVIELADAQMCVYWSQDVRGVLGLASAGPSKGCKVTWPVPSITLQGVTAVMEMAAEAVSRWQDRPWS